VFGACAHAWCPPPRPSLQLPQYYRNYKTQSAEALSPWFLAQWLLVRWLAEPLCMRISCHAVALHWHPQGSLQPLTVVLCVCVCVATCLQGDTFNLIGALLQGQQLPTTVYTAM
jgi:hypothetical protein